ncbi:amidohydrolase [Sandaracinobacteroides saxicola]|uniref:Amidohydrolase n=1 Tax=Sandaracinobacteroides saxicola TaxID=2759707 RepID=A0A7G5ILZ0_9SPHN|nr:amidohydrolase [Sandaracinobacteroides saxicola]QMW24382.1 amidohydrolase [Sandaracinobacteroides saxicola]
MTARPAFLAALLLAAAPLSADALGNGVKADLPMLVALYKALHAVPELSLQEEKTAARLAGLMRETGFEVTEKVGGHGVVAVLRNGAGPVLLIRTDIDGLPVREATGLPYASKATGKGADGTPVPVMHACGHDVHMAVWIGTARRLAADRSRWSGTLVMVAQPAEEIVVGAQAMLKDGLFSRFPKPTHALAIHDSASLPAGHVGWTDGFALANVDSVDITVRGIGSHGSQPHFGIDPVLIAARTVVTLQSIVARETDPLTPAVVTVGTIHGGTKRNIISDSVKLELTVRSYAPEVRARVLAAIERIANGEAMAAGVPADRMPVFARAESSDATFNTPKLTAQVAAALVARFGPARAYAVPPSMAAEDFGRFHDADKSIESSIFWVGGVGAKAWADAGGDIRKLPGLHSAYWAPDPEPTLATGVDALTTAALTVVGKQP